jgi:hypothetical protein
VLKGLELLVGSGNALLVQVGKEYPRRVYSSVVELVNNGSTSD